MTCEIKTKDKSYLVTNVSSLNEAIEVWQNSFSETEELPPVVRFIPYLDPTVFDLR